MANLSCPEFAHKSMDSFLSAANVLLPLAYLLVAANYGLLFFAGHPFARRTATPALYSVVGFHLVYLICLGVRWGQFPAATVTQSLTVVAFAVAVVYLLVEWRSAERSTGFWLMGLVFLIQLLASLMAHPEPPAREIFRSPLFAVHVSSALVGYAAFAVAAAYGFLFFRLYRELKRSRFSTFYGKLPPLEILDRMVVGALVVGFIGLTAALVSGIARVDQWSSGSWLLDPLTMMSFVVWTVYGGSLLLRRLRQWQGRQTALVSLFGLAVILISLVVVNLFFPGFHRLP